MKYKYGLLFIIERKGGKKKQTSLSVAEKKQKHAYRLMRAKRLTEKKKKREIKGREMRLACVTTCQVIFASSHVHTLEKKNTACSIRNRVESDYMRLQKEKKKEKRKEENGHLQHPLS